MNIIRLLGILAAFLFATQTATAADYYIRAGATGANNGTDWNNAYTSLPATLVRGATYYIAEGSYGSYTFDDPVSGSLVITIKKATASDHGTDTGWSSSYGDGQAEFGTVSFSSGYYLIDGQTGGGPGNWDSGYGIRIREKSNDSAKLVTIGSVSHLTLRHIDISYDVNEGLTFPCGGCTGAGDAVYGLNNVSYVIFSYCRFNKAGRTALLTRSDWDNIVIEYTYFRDCTIGTSSAMHGELWSADHPSGLTNVTFRYNYVKNFTSTGGLILAGGNGIDIYGNIFQGSVGQANGVIANWTSGALTTNVRIYNNTFVDADAYIGIGNNSGWVAYNNLFYSNSRVGFANTTHNYNWSDSNLSEANGQISSSNPFIASANGNFRLATATNAGNSSIGAPYNKDLDGNTRGADGTWDRGAYEYGGGGGEPTTHIVTPSVGPNGSINPNTPQTVNSGATTQFTVTPNTGYSASVGGTCGGSLVGTTYTTNPITVNCTVVATFTLITGGTQPSPPPAVWVQ